MLACEETPSVPAPSAPNAPVDAAAIARGEALVARFECARCHAIEGVSPPDRAHDCVGCHLAIRNGTLEATAEALARWQARDIRLVDVPSLQHIGDRLEPSAIARFVRSPYDVRPDFAPTMPRLAITDREAEDIAAFLTRHAAARSVVPSGDVARGRERFDALRCGRCHAYSGVVAAWPTPHESRLAPDLRHARERVRADRLAAWIRSPSSIEPGTAMPTTPMTEGDARDLAAFVLFAPLSPIPVPIVPTRLPILERRVTWAELETRIFRRVCWHCHGEPDYAHGDGGPGNTGGLGFPPRHVQLSSYAGALSGEERDGERVSLFRPGPLGHPMLVDVLLLRQREEAGQPMEGTRGMPLGLPSLTPEDVQLVETWIAQGRPIE